MHLAWDKGEDGEVRLAGSYKARGWPTNRHGGLSAGERCGSAILPVKRPCPCRRPRGLLRHLRLAAAHGLRSRTRSLNDVAAGAGRKSLWTERPRAPVRPLLSPQDPGTSSHPVEDETPGGNRLTSRGRGARGKGPAPEALGRERPSSTRLGSVLPRSRPPAPPRPGLGALARGRGGGGTLRPRSGRAPVGPAPVGSGLPDTLCRFRGRRGTLGGRPWAAGPGVGPAHVLCLRGFTGELISPAVGR